MLDTPLPPNRRFLRSGWIWCSLLAAWFAVLCLVPDPRPLGAPDWAMGVTRSVGLGEPAAHAASTLVLRAGGLALNVRGENALGALISVQ